MKKIQQTILLLMLAVVSFQCRKEPGYIGESDLVPAIPIVIPADPITAHIQGNILDENNAPAAGVSITTGNLTTVTDAKGYFRINNATLDKKNTLLVAQKSGYFKGMRLFAATSGTNQVVLKLIKKAVAGNIDAATGGTVTLSNGSKVSLPANAVVTASSERSYTGTITVYAQYIDPATEDIANTVPGSFSAINNAGKNVVLTSYGMLAVELESATGEKLQIKEGSVATLTTSIPAPAQASAPATIPLWFVDETSGLWREEGTATKQGTTYVGTVKHFSFWNCDFENSSAMLSMKVVNSNNIPLANNPVRITRPGMSWLTSATGYTDSLGQVSGIVPTNENLIVEVLDPCGNASYTQNISSITQNTDVGTITAAASSAGIITVKGKLVNCNNLPVTNGYARITIDNMERYAVTNTNGEYETSFIICSGAPSVATVLAVDNGTGGNAQQSSTVVVNLTAPVSNLADIVTCGSTDFAYINYNIDGTDYYWTTSNSFQMFGIYYQAMGGPGTDGVMFQADNQPNTRLFTLDINQASSVGAFSSGSFTTNDGFTSGIMTGIVPGTFTANLTKYAEYWPDYYEGSFSGQFTHSSTGSTLHTINGTFRIMHRF